MEGDTDSTTDLGDYQYNGTAIKNNTIINGTLNVTGNQEFDDGTFTFGEGFILNQTEDRWGISGGRTVKLIDGATLNYTSSHTAYFGRLTEGFTYNGTTSFILDNGVVCSSADIFFSPYTYSGCEKKNVVLNFTMINGSSLTSSKDLKFGAVEQANSKKHETEKVTIAVTNSTISAGKIHFGNNSNALSDQNNSFVKVSFGPGADITCRQFYVYKYPKSTIEFDGATVRTPSSNIDSNFFGKNGSVSNFDGYRLLPGGVTFDVTVDFTHGSYYAPLYGEGGFTKIGSGTLTYNRDAFKFTGPLTVLNGTFVSSQNMAASAFNVDGTSSVLDLSNATLANETVSLSATDGGTLTLVDASIADASPDMTLASNGKTDYFTRDNSVETHTLGALTLGESAMLSLTGGGAGVDAVSVDMLELSATEADKVAVSFTDAGRIVGGTYNLITITGGGSFASGDEKKFSLDANAPAGSRLSVSGASLQVAQSGTVALGGDLTLKKGASLGFNYTTRNEPVLNLDASNVMFDEGEATNIVVRISSDGGKKAKGGINVLTSGGRFSGVTVSLDPGAPAWATGVRVNSAGDIELNVKPSAFIMIFR